MRWSEELEGGGLMDVGCYCVSGMRLLAGEPLRVSAERVGTPVDGRVAAVLRFADDVTGTFDCGMDVYPAPAWRSSATRTRCGSRTRGTASHRESCWRAASGSRSSA